MTLEAGCRQLNIDGKGVVKVAVGYHHVGKRVVSNQFYLLHAFSCGPADIYVDKASESVPMTASFG